MCPDSRNLVRGSSWIWKVLFSDLWGAYVCNAIAQTFGRDSSERAKKERRPKPFRWAHKCLYGYFFAEKWTYKHLSPPVLGLSEIFLCFSLIFIFIKIWHTISMINWKAREREIDLMIYYQINEWGKIKNAITEKKKTKERKKKGTEEEK